ncbi:MAG TPA: Hpt domain-containing protein [Candidatus Thermoplasmatota archaeon]|nr:Hpt domain-containing protein [Candidatus Thermoplasmatota archaeon]
MSAVDASALQKLQEDLGGEPEVMRELIDTFFGEAPRLLETLREGLAHARVADLHRAAHSLKSTAGMFGATTLSSLCRELETLSIREMPRDAAARVAEIEKEWASVRAALERMRP